MEHDSSSKMNRHGTSFILQNEPSWNMIHLAK